MKSFYKIKISHANNGIIAEVGCIKLVYQQGQLELFADDLLLYLKDPDKQYKVIKERWKIEEADQAEAEQVEERRVPETTSPDFNRAIKADKR